MGNQLHDLGSYKEQFKKRILNDTIDCEKIISDEASNKNNIKITKRIRNAASSAGGKKKILKLITMLLLVSCICVSFSGCLFWEKEDTQYEKTQTPNEEAADIKAQESKETASDELKEEVSGLSEEETVEKIMQEMTLSDMVYQMLFVRPEAITGVGQAIQAGSQTKEGLANYPVGGIAYFAQNFQNREQTKEMIKNTKSYSKIPLFISVDEEGGRVSRLGANSQMGITKHPPMLEIGNTKDSQKAYEVGKTLAKELKELGFNMDFAPITDVLVETKTNEIGDRSFGSDPQIVAQMVRSEVTAMQKNGISATLKHFPGHASAGENSHYKATVSTRTLEQFKSTEFIPFIAGIDAGADFVMVSHMILINATEEKVPSSISKEIITDLLKNELGFKGIIITDSFEMGGIKSEDKNKQLEENVKNAVKAIEAGADMILMPMNMKATHDGIVAAVKSGEISAERIKESVRKIISLKVKKGMFE